MSNNPSSSALQKRSATQTSVTVNTASAGHPAGLDFTRAINVPPKNHIPPPESLSARGKVESKLIKSLKNIQKGYKIIVVAGQAGVGKSTFINTAAGQELLTVHHVHHKSDPVVSDPELVECSYNDCRVILVDTPGYDVMVGMEKLVKWLDSLNARVSGVLHLELPNSHFTRVKSRYLTKESPCPTVVVSKGAQFSNQDQEMQTLRFHGSLESAWSIISKTLAEELSTQTQKRPEGMSMGKVGSEMHESVCAFQYTPIRPPYSPARFYKRLRPTLSSIKNFVSMRDIQETLMNTRLWKYGNVPMPVYEEWDLRKMKEVAPVSVRDLDKDDIIIAVLGSTGAGKSTFIRTIAGENYDRNEVGHRLKSTTQEVQALRIKFSGSDKANLVLIDTPGLNNTRKSDDEILETIVQWLTVTKRKHFSRRQRLRLSGIFYLHCITDTGMPRSMRINFSMFQKLCGRDFYDRVVLTTTMWPDKTSPEYDPLDGEECKERERGLIDKSWRHMIDSGSNVCRFTRDLDSAQMMINFVIEQENQKRTQDLVQIQRVILRQLQSMPRTQTGRRLHGFMEGMVERQSGLLDQLELELGRSMDQDLEAIKRLLNDLKDLRQEREKALRDMQRLRRTRKLAILLGAT